VLVGEPDEDPTRAQREHGHTGPASEVLAPDKAHRRLVARALGHAARDHPKQSDDYHEGNEHPQREKKAIHEISSVQ
jgi:hypothetical protein